MKTSDKRKVGSQRPSQLIYTYGVGSTVDLPNLSVIVRGLDVWDAGSNDGRYRIDEPRLVNAVKQVLGPQVVQLFSPPVVADDDGLSPEEQEKVGVPVAVFPQWLVCKLCSTLAPLSKGVFDIAGQRNKPEETRYQHRCKRKDLPNALPVRFLVACEHGHLDDFPWYYFVHSDIFRGKDSICQNEFMLTDLSVSGEVADIFVRCKKCNKKRTLADAFGARAIEVMPMCSSRNPHLNSYDDDEVDEDGNSKACDKQMRTILLSASNSWFPLTMRVIHIPEQADHEAEVLRLVKQDWKTLDKMRSIDQLAVLRMVGDTMKIAVFSLSNATDEEIWRAIQQLRVGIAEPEVPAEVETINLKQPEWAILSQPYDAGSKPDPDFTVRDSPFLPESYGDQIGRVVLVDRLREVCALTGFKRIEPPDDLDEIDTDAAAWRNAARLSSKSLDWVPASVVRGEGIFIQFDEAHLTNWLNHKATQDYDASFHQAYQNWSRDKDAASKNKVVVGAYPGLRYVLLHSFAHALIRQLALECGYSVASIRERIYSHTPASPADEPMAGVLLYTSAADSEGTLGGLVRLGEGDPLNFYIQQAMEQMKFCSSDPLCANSYAQDKSRAVNGSACHACLYLPETSCERSNKYLDRTLLTATQQDATEIARYFAPNS